MAHALSITDGTTTVSLTTTQFMLLKYVPNAPLMDMERDVEDQRLTENIDLLAYGASTTAVQGYVNSVEELLMTARRRQRSKSGTRVFLQLQLEGESDTWRSEVTDGYIQLGQDSLTAWANKKVPITFIVERKVYWEGSRTQLVNAESIVNGEGGNSVEIAAASIEGVLPAPIEIKIENTLGGPVDWQNFYIAGNAFNDPANFSPWLAGSATPIAWSDNQTHATTLKSWTITDAQLADMQGDYFRFLIGYASAPSADAYAKLRVRFNSQVTLIEGDEVYTGASGGHYMEDMGAFPIPPNGAGSATLVTIAYSIRAESSGTCTIDFAAMLPADNFRRLHQEAISAADGSAIVDNGIEGYAYLDVSTAKYPIVATYGKPVMVYPGRINTIYVLFDEDGDFVASRSMDVSIWYRPRRLSI